MYKNMIIFLLFLTFNCALSQENRKIPIPDLFNTGVDNFKIPLADGETDMHYMLVQSADESFPGFDSKVVSPMVSYELLDAE
jgi:hypothetical protein